MILTSQGGERDLSKGLVEMRSIPELNEALAESETRPVLFFKHSLTCPISSRAFNELQSYLNSADAGLSYKLIIVQTARSVSNEIASRLRLEHETPQAILVRNGREVWNASHYEVTASALKAAIGKTS
jgi:bacillithiol system protein YtxJ